MNRTFTGVVAMASDRAIGFRQGIPWRLSEDMKLFKRLTMGHPILMGRKTWESLGRPLPGRQNIVLTRDANFTAEGASVIHSVDELSGLELMDSEVMVIGGAQIYAHLLPKMKKLYVSEVQGEYAADTWFPEFAHHFLRSTPVEQFDGFRLVLYEK
ncbi:MAG: dihydrofolate reductase [Akkermansia sp.]|nr:dihydrofolate reductase [Akkermansia sp.]